MPDLTPVAPPISGYRAVKYLGSGGFGDVFHYKHNATLAGVAVKVLRDGVSAGGAQELLHEAQALGRLSAAGPHPNIVAVQDVGTANGRPYLMMEYCPGGSLADLLSQPGHLPVSKVLSMGIQIAGALHMAHQAGIIHRDIKPGNILIGAKVGGQGIPKLADFGIATLTIEEAARGSAWLSPDYAAPEVVESGEADQLSDLFSLAATLYHALAGRSWIHAPGGDNSASARERRIQEGQVPPIGGGTPESLEWMLRATMATDRAIRERNVPDAREFALRLRDIQFELHYDRTPVPIEEPTENSKPISGYQIKPAWTPKAKEIAALADTGRRPQPEPAEEQHPLRRKRFLVWAAGAGAALLFTAAVFTAALALSGNQGSPSQTPGPAGDAAVPDRQPVPVPKVEARRTDATTVLFTWTYPDPQPGDTYRIVVAGAPSTLTGQPQWTVTPVTAAELCVEVMVVRFDGRTTATGGKACA